MNWLLLRNSMLVAGFTTLLAVGLGFLAALWLTGCERRWRNRLLLAAVTALVMPPFLVTNCWLDLLGTTGTWRRWLPLNIYSFGGAVWILTLLTWPVTLLLVQAAWRRLEAAQLDSDAALVGWPLIRWLLWPAARVAVGQAAVLTFVLTLNNFAVPAILQVRVFPAEVWIRFNTHLNPVQSLVAGWPLVVAPLLLLLLLRRADLKWPREQRPATARALRRQVGPDWFWISATLTTGILVLSVGLPLAGIITSGRTWAELPNLVRAAPGAIWNSVAYALVTASLCVVMGLAGSRIRVTLSLWLPFLLPGVMVGLGMVWVFNREAFAPLYGSAAVVIAAFTVRYLALGWNVAGHAMRSVDRDLVAAARLDGAEGWKLFQHGYWPQIRPQVAAGWYLTYLFCLWDIETLVLICPPGGETLALKAFNLLHYGHNVQVNALCMVLLAIAVAPLAVWATARRRAGDDE